MNLNAKTIILIIMTVYCLLFIQRNSFDVFGEKYFVLADDVMISMDYAKNFVEGNGLVWYKGAERVEGYSNPLWVLYMTIPHILHIPLSKTSLFIQISGMIILMLTVYYTGKLAEMVSGSSIVAMIFVASYYPILYWSLMGFEVSILMLITVVVALAGVKCIKRREPLPVIYYVLIGLATLIRIDMVVIYISVWLYFVYKNTPNNRIKSIVHGGAILAVFLGIQTVFRLWYFGDILPNTYYLKMTGYPVLMRIKYGFIAYWHFALRYYIVVPVIPFLFLNKYTKYIAWLFIAQSAYSIYAGGDAWEQFGGSNRFISVVIPLFFVLLSVSIVRICKNYLHGFDGWKTLIPTVVCIIIFNHAVFKEQLMLVRPFDMNGIQQMVERGLIFKRFLPADYKIAVIWAGIIPYFSEMPCTDIQGKCDKYIARKKSDDSYGYNPGHMKWDYDYSLNKLKPDIIPFIVSKQKEVLYPIIRENYTEITVNPNPGEVNHSFYILNKHLKR